MPDLSDLISRVEKASGPDRELDLAVHVALFPDSEIAGWMKYPRGLEGCEGYSWDIHRACVVFEKRTADGRCPHNGGVPLPFYTASLDAVLTLLPEGYAVTDMSVWPGERSSCVVIGTKLRPFGKDRRMSWVHASGDGKYCGDGATLPLALLSAILRARQAMQMEARCD